MCTGVGIDYVYTVCTVSVMARDTDTRTRGVVACLDKGLTMCEYLHCETCGSHHVDQYSRGGLYLGAYCGVCWDIYSGRQISTAAMLAALRNGPVRPCGGAA